MIGPGRLAQIQLKVMDGRLRLNKCVSRDEILDLIMTAERYEKLRKLNVRQFGDLYEANIRGEGRFDDLVDQLED